MVITLLGTLNVKFLDIEGNDQTIKIQLPDYVLANFIHVEGKPRMSLISGTMVLSDEINLLKSVIKIKGLVKKKTMFTTTYEPNIPKKKEDNLIEGIIYKQKTNFTKSRDFEKLGSLPDIEFQLAEISGQAIDKPVIQNISYSNWAGVHFADPIP